MFPLIQKATEEMVDLLKITVYYKKQRKCLVGYIPAGVSPAAQLIMRFVINAFGVL